MPNDSCNTSEWASSVVKEGKNISLVPFCKEMDGGNMFARCWIHCKNLNHLLLAGHCKHGAEHTWFFFLWSYDNALLETKILNTVWVENDLWHFKGMKYVYSLFSFFQRVQVHFPATLNMFCLLETNFLQTFLCWSVVVAIVPSCLELVETYLGCAALLATGRTGSSTAPPRGEQAFPRLQERQRVRNSCFFFFFFLNCNGTIQLLPLLVPLGGKN